MPEVIRRIRGSVTTNGAERFNIRVSAAASQAIRDAAAAAGYANAVQWCREQLERAAGYAAPVEGPSPAPWEVGEDGEPLSGGEATGLPAPSARPPKASRPKSRPKPKPRSRSIATTPADPPPASVGGLGLVVAALRRILR